MVQISDKLFDRLPDLLRLFNIDYVEYPNRYAFPCPIHGGDNPEGCCIFTDGISSKGNWQCWTQHCEEDFNKHVFGFVRGVLSEKENRKVSITETAKYCADFLSLDIDNIQESDTSQNDNVKILDVFNKAIVRECAALSREDIRSSISIPSTYFIERGFEPETLDFFDVGECMTANKPMSKRAVVPVMMKNIIMLVVLVGLQTNR